MPGAAQLPFRSARRVSPVRQRRRKRRIFTAAAFAVFILAAAGGISYASYLPQYTIQSIDVAGAQTVPANLIQAYAESIIHDGSRHFISRANIFIYPQAVIETDTVKEFPRIASAQVTRASVFANAITITVTERQPFALWCDAANTCFDLDQTGFIFAPADQSASSTGRYIFGGSLASSTNPIGQMFAAGHLPGLVAFLQRLGQTGFTPTGATVANDQDFVVPLSQGFSVYASFGQNTDTLASNLQLMLSSSALSGQEQNLEYVDLRFGDKVYYKLKGQAETQSPPKKH